MVDDLPAGPFDVVFVAYNTLFNLDGRARRRPASRPSPHAWRPAGGSSSRRSCPTTRRAGDRRRGAVDDRRSSRAVDLRPRSRRPAADGQFVEFTEAGGVRLRPWSIRYATPAELDAYGRGRRAARSSSAGRTFDAATVRRRQPAPRERLRRRTSAHVTALPNCHAVARDGRILRSLHESDATEPAHRAVGHDRGRAGPAPDRLRAAGRSTRSTPADRPCPFCPGNEESHAAGARDDRRGRQLADAGGAQPVPRVRRRDRASPSTTSARCTSPPRRTGIHEVFVYTPDHDGGLDQLDDDARRRVHARPQAPAHRARRDVATSATPRSSSTTAARPARRSPTRTARSSACRSCRARSSTRSGPSPASPAAA